MRPVLSVAVLLALAACTDKSAQQAPPGAGMPPTRVETAKAATRELPDSVNAVGSLRAIVSAARPEPRQGNRLIR